MTTRRAILTAAVAFVLAAGIAATAGRAWAAASSCPYDGSDGIATGRTMIDGATVIYEWRCVRAGHVYWAPAR